MINSNLIKSLRVSKYASYIIVLTFALSIFAQCLLFHYFIYTTISHAPIFYPSLVLKLSISIFISTFILITKKKYWSVIVSIIIAIWSMAELIYFRSNNIFIEEYSITMIGNMGGVWDSIWLFNKLTDWILLAPTLVLVFVLWLFNNNSRHISSFILLLFLSFLLNYWSCVKVHIPWNCEHKECTHGFNVLNPFASNGTGTYLGLTTEHYIGNTSVLHSLIFQFKELIYLPFKNEKYNLTEEENANVSYFINQSSNVNKPNSSIIILLIESFEAWAITSEVTPNLYKFINETNHLLYANKMIPQVRHGVSADGQMIVNTGLLPVTDGAACYRFPDNEYPSISHIYENPGLISALNLMYWNQKFMSDSYGIKKNYIVESWHDKNYFEKVNELKDKHDFLMSLTMTMHAPFNSCPENEYPRVEGMSDEIYRYLNSVKYMDKYLGKLLTDLMTNPQTKDATIVITADHNVLSQDSRTSFNVFNKEHNLGFGEINGNIPFILYSPQIDNKVIINDPVYQMDIFPTLMGVLGCENYFWKGFGVNLLKQNSWNNRPIQPHEAQVLSDKIIRANYFNNK